MFQCCDETESLFNRPHLGRRRRLPPAYVVHPSVQRRRDTIAGYTPRALGGDSFIQTTLWFFTSIIGWRVFVKVLAKVLAPVLYLVSRF